MKNLSNEEIIEQAKKVGEIIWKNKYIVCATHDGYSCYTPTEYVTLDAADLTADLNGNLSWQGQSTGTQIPKEILDRV